MNTPTSSNQNTFTHTFQFSSICQALEQGLIYIRQGRYTEGVSCLALVREQLPDEQIALVPLLDAFIEGHTTHWQVQHTLHEASRRFAEEDAAQRTRLTDIETLLPTLKYELQASPPASPAASTSRQTSSHCISSPSSLSQQLSTEEGTLPALSFTCFGRFEVRRLEQRVTLCSNRNGQTILRYLVAQPDRSATMDVLMAALWPDDELEVAHHKLQVAVSALRRSLNSNYTEDPGSGYIRCKQGTYQLNPSIPVSSDVDEFVQLYHAGRRATDNTTITFYEQACKFYIGPFLQDDLYADWSSVRREQLRSIYLAMCKVLTDYYIETGNYEEAIPWATAMLKENACDEVAHRQLMRIYATQGRRSEAIRQFHHCQHTLFTELGVEPMSETLKLFHTLLTNQPEQ
jgi:DNA-binding SARP family transcriptional activator